MRSRRLAVNGSLTRVFIGTSTWRPLLSSSTPRKHCKSLQTLDLSNRNLYEQFGARVRLSAGLAVMAATFCAARIMVCICAAALKSSGKGVSSDQPERDSFIPAGLATRCAGVGFGLASASHGRCLLLPPHLCSPHLPQWIGYIQDWRGAPHCPHRSWTSWNYWLEGVSSRRRYLLTPR